MFCTNCGKQQREIHGYCTYCGSKLIIPKKITQKKKDKDKGLIQKFKTPLKIVGVIGLFLIFLLWMSDTGYEDDYSNDLSTNYTQPQVSKNTQEEIAASVVNIYCPSTSSESEGGGGSGTIIDEDGLILTNSHIIPQDETYVHTGEMGCMVILPDPTTGSPDEAFLAEPIVIPRLSETYDLAFIEIYAAYYDEEEEEYAGTYPRKFPAFDDTSRCIEENVQLGEPVRIFGYPSISGGYSLTVTDGVVSSFPGEGLIMTSAKISQGNSGGLAVDRNGCMIGVPSMVSWDEYESLGVIISNDLIYEFVDEFAKQLDLNN
jgi:hypothetical protein